MADARGDAPLEDCAQRQVHEIWALWWHRIVPYQSYLKGFKIAPTHFINQDLARLWLDK